MAEAENPTKYLATLVGGGVHYLKDIRWDNGRTVVINEDQMVHLEEHAVDVASVSDGSTITKDKFEFEPYDGEHPVGYTFPTEEEVEAKEQAAKLRERSRRIAMAKADVPRVETAPRARSRSRG